MSDKPRTRVDRSIERIKNNPLVASLIVLGIIVIALASFTDALVRLKQFFSSPPEARPAAGGDEKLFLEVEGESLGGATKVEVSRRFDGEPLITTDWKATIVNIGTDPVTVLEVDFWQLYDRKEAFHSDLIKSLTLANGENPSFPFRLQPGDSLVMNVSVRVPLRPEVLAAVDSYGRNCPDQSLTGLVMFLAYHNHTDIFGNKVEPAGNSEYIKKRGACEESGGFSLPGQYRNFSLLVDIRTAKGGKVRGEGHWHPVADEGSA